MSSSDKSAICDLSKALTLEEHKLATFKTYVSTYNVGNAFPNNISLRDLLGLHTDTDEENLPDIYALGFQKVALEDSMTKFHADSWTYEAKKILCDYDYVLIGSERMLGLLLNIFVRRKHIPHLRNIVTHSTGTGVGSLCGNKGIVSARFNLYGCNLVFVCAHLATQEQNLDKLIKDYKQILEQHYYHVPNFREINDHDYVFWFGDLNFRLEGGDSSKNVLEAIKEGKLEDLLQRDQLKHVRANTKEAFNLLHEETPTFPPTFKFKVGTSEYDLKRCPAWTDRILYAVQPLNRQPNMALAIDQCSYKSHPSYCISAHKPVTCEFTMKIYSDYRAPCVTFRDIAFWNINEQNTVEYTKPLDFEEYDGDYIAFLPANFSNFNDLVTYAYVDYAQSPSTSFDSQVGSKTDDNSYCQRFRCEQQGDSEVIRTDFHDDIKLEHGKRYLLIYFKNNAKDRVISVGGISNAFLAEKRASAL